MKVSGSYIAQSVSQLTVRFENAVYLNENVFPPVLWHRSRQIRQSHEVESVRLEGQCIRNATNRVSQELAKVTMNAH